MLPFFAGSSSPTHPATGGVSDGYIGLSFYFLAFVLPVFAGADDGDYRGGDRKSMLPTSLPWFPDNNDDDDLDDDADDD